MSEYYKKDRGCEENRSYYKNEDGYYDRKKMSCDYEREYCDCKKEKDFAKCEPLSPCPKKILLECGTPNGEFTFTESGQSFIVGNVTVDTSCFCKPITDLQFTSQVKAVLTPIADVTTPVDAEVVLLYELCFRRNGGYDVCIGAWTFRRFLSAPPAGATTVQTLETTDTFSFNRCTCSSPCQGCIDYFVRVTANIVSVDSTMANNASATVSMGQLDVKVQDC